MALTPWIRIGQPLEAVMSDYERIFDAWEQGGIRGLVFGRLLFADEQGHSRPCLWPPLEQGRVPSPRSRAIPRPTKSAASTPNCAMCPCNPTKKSSYTPCWPTPKIAAGP